MINRKRDQAPPFRDTGSLILKKTAPAAEGPRCAGAGQPARGPGSARFLTGDARATPELEDGAVALTVTSPPFLDVVQYTGDNWLRCWFNGLDAEAVAGGHHHVPGSWRPGARSWARCSGSCTG